MNTILISGTCKNLPNKVQYDVIFWASKAGEPLQLISEGRYLLSNNSRLWDTAKAKAALYFGDSFKFDDGAYTQYLQHLTPVNK